MAANGSGLQLAMVHNIALAWVLPLPAARAFFFLFVANRAAKTPENRTPDCEPNHLAIPAFQAHLEGLSRR
jgi:hypothetical protein